MEQKHLGINISATMHSHITSCLIVLAIWFNYLFISFYLKKLRPDCDELENSVRNNKGTFWWRSRSLTEGYVFTSDRLGSDFQGTLISGDGRAD